MSRGTKRALWIGLMVLAVAASMSSFWLGAQIQRSVSPHAVAIVGDPAVADGPQVLAEMQRSAERQVIGVPFGPSLGNVGGAVLALLWLLTGVLIFTRQPGNRAGWVFLAIGLAWILGTLAVALVVWDARLHPGRLPLRAPIALVGEVGLFPVILVPLLFLLFPDGHPPTPRWRWAAIGLVGGGGVAVLGLLVSPGPLNNYVSSGVFYENPVGMAALGQLAPALIGVGTIIALAAAISCVVAVRGRFKRSSGEERQQLRWLVSVATMAGALLVLGILVTILVPKSVGTRFDWIFNAVIGSIVVTVALGIPVAYLIAIYRYGLWDLDVVIRKALVVALVALGLTVVAIVVPIAVVALVGVGGTIEPLSVLIGVLLGLLFWPVRRWARRVADRYVYGSRATPYEVLTDFGHRVSETYSADDVVPRMAQVLGEATGASVARVWIKVGAGLAAVATWPPDAADATRSVPIIGDHVAIGADAWEVRHQGVLLGALSVEMPANDPMDRVRAQLGADLAGQAGLVLRNVGLIEELRASRRRIVTAQDERAKKLERNIHDGAQQQLVALSVKLRLAETLAERDPDRAKTILAELQGDAASALEDLRDLARGIYPPLLADQGLVAALEAQARKAIAPTTVRAKGVGRYPADVEAAVYFCSLEALQNVAKYARADSVRIDLAQTDGHLDFAVVDDGAGFDPAEAHGSGLQGMQDRLEALGGSVQIQSRKDVGTQVRGTVPVAPAVTPVD